MKHLGRGALLLAALAAAPRTAGAVASAELYRTQAYVYGRFEARVRYGAGDGIISSFFLWKEGSEATNAYWNELDFEKVGADCHMQTNAIYGNPEAEHSQTNAMPGDICSSYHDYRFEWTPDYIAWSVDGKEFRRETGATAQAFSQNASSGMTFHFNIWPGNANFGGNFNASVLPVHQFISWVQYSSYANGSFQLAWREDFDGSSVPSGWSTGTWASPYSLSTHNTANVKFVNGFAVLSLTADNATGFTGTPPADNGASAGGTSAGGTSAGGTSAGGTSAGGSGSVLNRGGSSNSSSAMPAGGSSSGGASNGSSVTGGVANRGGSSSSDTATSNRGGTTAAATGSGGTVTATSGSGAPTGGAITTSATPNRGGATNGSGGATAKVSSSSTTAVANGGQTQPSVGGATSASSSTASARGGAVASSVGSSMLGGAAQATTAAAPPDDGGCGCRVATRSRDALPFAAMSLLAFALRRRRRPMR
jgi:MYXO-CTERM domain-containing protein